MGSVVKAVNRAFERMETRPFWKVRVIAVLLVVANGIVLAGVFLLLVFGGAIGDAIAKQAGLGHAFTLVWNIARWPLVFVAILLFFALVFYLAPNKDQRNWRWVTPGSVLATVVWLAASGAFAVYTSSFGSYNKTWGSLAAVIVMLTWLWLAAIALLLGAELNAEAERSRELREGEPAEHELQVPSRAA